MEKKNYNYVEYLLEKNETIYIDTSTLMNIEQLRLFIGRVEETFIVHNRKIIVPNVVYTELRNHLTSECKGKREKAINALSIVEQFSELFDIEKEYLEDGEFADPELLARITVNRSSVTQLLITNDNRLSADAFMLNEQKSIKGCKVMVCRINGSGYLNRCGYVKEHLDNLQSKGQERNSELNNSNEENNSKKLVYVYRDKKEEKPWYKSWKGNTLFGIGLFTGGIAVDRYVLPLIRSTVKAA